MAIRMEGSDTTAEPSDIVEFFAGLGCDIVVGDRGPREARAMRYYASADNVEVSDGAFLVSSMGNGVSPDAAIRDYARVMSHVDIVIGAYTSQRREVRTPRLSYKKRPRTAAKNP